MSTVIRRSASRSLATLACVACGMMAPAHAETILASNYASSYTSWSAGSNQSTNFGAWSFSSNNNGSTLFAGNFLGSSTAGAGDINTSGNSFALYANPNTAFIDASMGLNGQLTTGNTLRFSLAVNFDNGNKGFELLTGGGAKIINWNLGGGASTSSDFTRTQTTGTYNYGGNAVINVALTMTSTSDLSYLITRPSASAGGAITGTLFEGTVSGISGSPANLKFYVASTDPGGAAQNNLYFNSVEVVPEPQSLALLACGVGSLVAAGWRRARKVGRG